MSLDLSTYLLSAPCQFDVAASSGAYVFVQEPSTTEIYTYRPTLSLPDALPISNSARNSPFRPSGSAATSSPATATKARRRCRSPTKQRCSRCRSEEHTSELQSLMRISYAVFCLKKKKWTTKSKNHNQQRS